MEKTLRDEIAIAALHGILSNTNTKSANYDRLELVEEAYEVADAVLKQREKATNVKRELGLDEE